MTTPLYFGFGSLVNAQTLPDGARWQRATLRGWRRSWRHPIAGEHRWAAMDVLPDPDGEIDGLLLVGGGELDDYLVQREDGYRATPLAIETLRCERAPTAAERPQLWTSCSPAAAGDPLWLMQSYVDVVMAGYLREFGEAGLVRFIESTDNWQLPCFDDRQLPRYPRAVALSPREREIIEALQPRP